MIFEHRNNLLNLFLQSLLKAAFFIHFNNLVLIFCHICITFYAILRFGNIKKGLRKYLRV